MSDRNIDTLMRMMTKADSGEDLKNTFIMALEYMAALHNKLVEVQADVVRLRETVNHLTRPAQGAPSVG